MESLRPVYISKDIQHCILGQGSELAKRAGHSRAGSNGPRRVLVGQIPSLLIAVKPTITVRLLALKWFCLHDFASGMNQTLGTLVSAQNTAQNGHYRRTQAYDFHH
jgi:hypothetical protein